MNDSSVDFGSLLGTEHGLGEISFVVTQWPNVSSLVLSSENQAGIRKPHVSPIFSTISKSLQYAVIIEMLSPAQSAKDPFERTVL
jgi:hypothetical protein